MPGEDESKENALLKSFWGDANEGAKVEIDPTTIEDQIKTNLHTGKTVTELLALRERQGKETKDDEVDDDEDEQTDEQDDEQDDEQNTDDKTGDNDDEQPSDKPDKPERFVSGFDEVEPTDRIEEETPDDDFKSITDEGGPLDSEEQRTVEFWKFAEEKYPDKFAGQYEKAKQFIKEHRKAKARFFEADPDTPLEENDDYVRWLNSNRPKIAPSDGESIREEMLVEKADKKAQERFDQLKKEEDEKKLDDRIEEAVERFTNNMTPTLKYAAPEDESIKAMVTLVEEGGANADTAARLVEEFPEQGEILLNGIGTANAMARRWLQYTSGRVRLDANSEMDRVLVSKLHSYENEILNNDKYKEKRVRGGRTLVRRSQFLSMSSEDRKKHWVLSNDQYLHALKTEWMGSVVDNIKKSGEKFKKIYGMTPYEARLAKNKKQGSTKKEKETKVEPEENIPAASNASPVSKPIKADDAVSELINKLF
jgi:hypothetical protein